METEVSGLEWLCVSDMMLYVVELSDNAIRLGLYANVAWVV